LLLLTSRTALIARYSRGEHRRDPTV
jgi:hypothetical protein